MKNKWIVLGVFSLAAGLSQFLWLNFAPVITLIEKKYSISENEAGLLILVFPLIYIFLSIPAGNLIDKKGFRYATCFGAILMAIFSWVRVLDFSFSILLIGQIGIAIAQPYVINSISKIIMNWFSAKETATATGLGTVGMFVGMALAMGLTPPTIEHFGFQGAMIAFALASTVICLLCLAIIYPNPSGAVDQSESYKSGSFKILIQNKYLVLVFILAFLGLGFFNGLTTWLELILTPNGINSDQAGVIGAVLILGGIVGAAIVPFFSDLFNRRKPFVLGSIAAALLTVYPLCTTKNYSTLLVLAALQGFFFLPAFSLLIEVCSELAGATLAGSATGILMLAGNAGGVIVIVAMEAVKEPSGSFYPAVLLLVGILGIALGLSLFIKETHRNFKN